MNDEPCLSLTVKDISMEVNRTPDAVNITLKFATVQRFVPPESVQVSFKKTRQKSLILTRHDYTNLDSFYAFIRRNCNEIVNNRFLLWVITDQSNGFIATTDHLHATMMFHEPIGFIVGTVAPSVGARLTEQKSGSKLPSEITALFKVIEDVEFLGATTPKAVLEKVEAKFKKERTEILSAQNNLEFHNCKCNNTPGKFFNPNITKIEVWSKYSNLLLALNSTLYTIDEHLSPRKRTNQVDFELVYEIVHKIIESHSIEETDN